MKPFYYQILKLLPILKQKTGSGLHCCILKIIKRNNASLTPLQFACAQLRLAISSLEKTIRINQKKGVNCSKKLDELKVIIDQEESMMQEIQLQNPKAASKENAASAPSNMEASAAALDAGSMFKPLKKTRRIEDNNDPIIASRKKPAVITAGLRSMR